MAGESGKRAELAFGLGRGGCCRLSVHAEPMGFTQSRNIYWSPTMCMERDWGFERATQSFFGGDMSLQTIQNRAAPIGVWEAESFPRPPDILEDSVRGLFLFVILAFCA